MSGRPIKRTLRGQTRSDEIAITPLEGTTVSLGAAPAVPGASVIKCW